MQDSDSQGNNPYKTRASFQGYRVQDSDSEEEITTRQEPSFIPDYQETTMEQGQGQRVPTIEEQMVMLMTGMQRLLQQQGNTTSNNFTRPKLPEPDTYHGDRSPGAVESWIRTMERYLQLTSLNDHEWVPFAVMKLRDEAEEWWQQRSLYGPEVSEWTEFRKHIIVEFRPLNATQQARDKLAVLRQTGTVVDYVAQFRGVRIQIPTMTDEEALDRFTRGLQDDIRAHVVTRFPSTSEEAQRMALAYESARNIRHELSNTTNPRQDVRSPEYLRSNDVAPMDLDVIRSRPFQQGWRNYGGQSRSRSSRTPSSMHNKQCFNCGGMGHVARLCPSQPGSSSSRFAGRGRQTGDLKDQARKE